MYRKRFKTLQAKHIVGKVQTHTREKFDCLRAEEFWGNIRYVCILLPLLYTSAESCESFPLEIRGRFPCMVNVMTGDNLATQEADYPDRCYTSQGPLARYVKLRVAHAPGMPGTFSPPPRVSDSDMHGTCGTHVPWCMLGLLTSSFLWSRWRGKCSRHSRRMRNPQFYVSGKRTMV